MSKTLVLRAKGQGGVVDPASTAYISINHDSAAPDGPWVRAKIDDNSIELLETLDLEWEDFLKLVDETENKADYTAALDKARHGGGKNAEKERQRAEKEKADAEKEKADAEKEKARLAAEKAEAEKARLAAAAQTNKA